MAVGTGVIVQARLRPIRTVVGAANGNGGGINYGMGIGSVRIAGVTYSVADASGQYDMSQQSFVGRVAVINGDYPFPAAAFTTATDLLVAQNCDVLLDHYFHDAGPTTIPTWMAGLVTDEGLNVTALIAEIAWPTGGGAPPGITPQLTLQLHGDHYANRRLALSPGSIFREDV